MCYPVCVVVFLTYFLLGIYSTGIGAVIKIHFKEESGGTQRKVVSLASVGIREGNHARGETR